VLVTTVGLERNGHIRGRAKCWDFIRTVLPAVSLSRLHRSRTIDKCANVLIALQREVIFRLSECLSRENALRLQVVDTCGYRVDGDLAF
jgi:hypothetical protein